jgi:uncharacterized metal-binding protein YceD (DUF177 family)
MSKTSKPPAAPAWSAPIAAGDIPETGRRIDLVADETIRQSLVETAGLAALPRLEASFDVTRQGDGLHVTGRVIAMVVQNCVVTLEPVESSVDEVIDLTFLPDAEPPAEVAGTADADDPPEPLRNGVVDLGAIATEFLLLGIDPYPRKPDAVFDLPPADDPSSHPFAALAALKKPGAPDQG